MNKVELRGILGAIRLQNVGGSSYATMTVATNYCYKDRNGCPVIETTWHLVTAWESQGCQDLSSLHKGDKVHVIGRLRCRKYMDVSGMERSQIDIVASNLERDEHV